DLDHADIITGVVWQIESEASMSDALRPAIDELVVRIQQHLDEVAELKRAVNALCKVMSTEPMYADIEQEQAQQQIGPTRPDLYYGMPLSTAVRRYLESRKRACGGEEILNALQQGGFDFDSLSWKDENR